MYYDLICLGVLLFAAIRGAAKGMAWQLAAIASLVLCFLFATPLSLTLMPLIQVDPPLNRWIALLAIYVLFSFVCFGVARGFRSWLEKARFVEFDKHLGFIFGALKGATICMVATFFLVGMSDAAEQYIMTTKTGYISAVVASNLRPVIPAELADLVAPYINRLPAPDTSNVLDPEEATASGWRPATDGKNRYQPSNEFRGNNRSERTSAPNNAPATGAISLEGLANQISGLIQKKVEDGFTDALNSTLPESEQPQSPPPAAGDREERENPEGLPNGLPGERRPRDRGERRSGEPRQDRREARSDGASREALAQGIGGLFSDKRRSDVESRIEQLLKDVPEDVSKRALLDWHSDLMGKQPDPDPETDVTAPLERRLRRQLEQAGISLRSLPPEVQERLKAVR